VTKFTKTEQMRREGTLPEGSHRCIATRSNGEPCRAWPVRGTSVCKWHGGSAPQVKRKAQERLEFAADKAAQKLIEFMNSSKVPYPVRLQACRDLLDRAGLKAGTELTIQLRKFEQDIEGLFVDVVSDDIVDAQVVEDEGDPLQLVDRSETVRSREKRATSSSTPTPTSARQSRVRRG
jgi:hypothetical protein